MTRFLLLIFCCIPLFTTGCELYTQDDYREYYVVESYLVAGRNLPRVRVSHTLPVEEEYLFERAAINDAIVKIRLLNSNGNIEEDYGYVLESNGVYRPLFPAEVLPGRRYELSVTFSGNSDEVTAQTLVPGSFHITGDVADSAVYQSPEQVEIMTTRSNYPGRQAFFIFTVNVVNPSKEKLTPFYLEQVEEQDVDIANFYVNGSGILNEQTFDINPDGTVTLWLPWLAVAFYEENAITANAIDDNMYDFLRSQSMQGGGSTLSPGQIPNIKYNVEGGIGVFGSMASDTARIFIKRQ